jgi:hypothetical protein
MSPQPTVAAQLTRTPERNSLEADLFEPRNVRWRNDQQHSKELRRQPRAKDTSHDRDGNALDDKQPDDASGAGAQRPTDRDLLLARRSPEQEQIADVEARREQ